MTRNGRSVYVSFEFPDTRSTIKEIREHVRDQIPTARSIHVNVSESSKKKRKK